MSTVGGAWGSAGGNAAPEPPEESLVWPLGGGLGAWDQAVADEVKPCDEVPKIGARNASKSRQPSQSKGPVKWTPMEAFLNLLVEIERYHSTWSAEDVKGIESWLEKVASGIDCEPELILRLRKAKETIEARKRSIAKGALAAQLKVEILASELFQGIFGPF